MQLSINDLENNLDFKHIVTEPQYPTTRFQGSKAKLIDWIWDNISDLEFDNVLDAFGGTGVVSYKMKQMGKNVIYNDLMHCNCIIAEGLIKNCNIILEKDEVLDLLKPADIIYPTFIQNTFKDIFYTDQENRWLDMMITNISNMENKYKKSIAWFALFQSCIIKRPYNLFHRANLYVRLNDVQRSFGNKTTWETSFETHFLKFVEEANNAIFDNDTQVTIMNGDIFDFEYDENIDLVYIDTPYITSKGVGTDYYDFYHFIEGMTKYEEWPKKILEKYKHKPLKGRGENVWIKKKVIHDSFDRLFSKFKDSILVISYRDDGIPSIDEIKTILSKYKKDIIEVYSKDYRYVLSKNKSKEVMIIAK